MIQIPDIDLSNCLGNHFSKLAVLWATIVSSL